MWDIEAFIETLRTANGAFVQVNGEADWRDGWKISVQGRTLEDSKYLFENLIELLVGTKASFKFGTQRLINLGREHEQSTKLLTIYIPNGVEAKSYAELVRINLLDYKGADDIPDKKGYTKHAPGIFYRNDRDENGKYVYPK